jgi:translation initiation factor 4E
MPLGAIPTIEHWFNYYVHMKKPSEMPREIDLFFFREHLVPMWEESPNGGIIILKVKRDDNIDKMWESILFALFGKCANHKIVNMTSNV